MNFNTFATNFKNGMSKNAPSILKGFGICGFVGAAVLVGVKTPEAQSRIEEAKKELDKEKLTPLETIQATWKCYLPALTLGALSAGSIVCSDVIVHHRVAALVTAYTATANNFKDYKDSAEKLLNPSQTSEIEAAINDNRFEKNKDIVDNEIKQKETNESKEITSAVSSGAWVYDSAFGRVFYSSIDRIKNAVNELNRSLTTGMEEHVTLNDFYFSISDNLDPVDCGEMLFWDIDNYIELGAFTAKVLDNGTPCIVMNYSHLPRPDSAYGSYAFR